VIITVSELPGSSSARVKRTPQQSYDFQNGEHPVGHAESRHVFGSSEAGDVRKELDAVSRKELSVATGRKVGTFTIVRLRFAIWFCAKFKIGPKGG
jgi:hypothetical protein